VAKLKNEFQRHPKKKIGIPKGRFLAVTIRPTLTSIVKSCSQLAFKARNEDFLLQDWGFSWFATDRLWYGKTFSGMDFLYAESSTMYIT
jgi:hypothetical protein